MVKNSGRARTFYMKGLEIFFKNVTFVISAMLKEAFIEDFLIILN